jgi:hypothetical protein
MLTDNYLWKYLTITIDPSKSAGYFFSGAPQFGHLAAVISISVPQ